MLKHPHVRKVWAIRYLILAYPLVLIGWVRGDAMPVALGALMVAIDADTRPRGQ